MSNVEMNDNLVVEENNGLFEEMNDHSAVDVNNELDENHGVNVEMNDYLDENNRLHEFVNQLMLSEERAASIIKKIVDDLKNIFKKDFPYEIVPFGSYVNGLRCVDSDVDICLSMTFFPVPTYFQLLKST